MFAGEIKYDALKKDICVYGNQGDGLTMFCDSEMKELGTSRYAEFESQICH